MNDVWFNIAIISLVSFVSKLARQSKPMFVGNPFSCLSSVSGSFLHKTLWIVKKELHFLAAQMFAHDLCHQNCFRNIQKMYFLIMFQSKHSIWHPILIALLISWLQTNLCFTKHVEMTGLLFVCNECSLPK